MNARTPITAQTLRCAIYTRKSSDEGLEQDFNSLHAQREACEAYARPQVHEGWLLIPTAYDDGGFSGGDMQRPALKRLLEDIRAGLVDVVLVYKVDRLTRSLADFAKIVETFDEAGASFVSVTQSFNTTSSMGRLTLNVLLSFAQFEREVTGERIRDKIAQSKAKGMWMGGMLPLGYDLGERALVINPQEAELVRHIYARYLKLGSVTDLRDELEAKGVRSKLWTARSGKVMGGAVLARGALFHLLQNRLYLGEIRHREKVHPGQHAAIVDLKLFEAVQRKLERNRVKRRTRPKRSDKSLLIGKIFTAAGEPMSPSFGYGRGGTLYRYYIAMSLQVGASKQDQAAPIQRVSADAVERFVLDTLRRLAGRDGLSLQDAADMLRRLELRISDTQMVLDAEALFGLDHPELAFEDLQGRLQPSERAVKESGRTAAIRIALPVRAQFRGGRTWIAGEGVLPLRAPVDQGLVDALRSAHAELATLNASPLTPREALRDGSAPEGAHRRQVSRLTFLAPDLQEQLLAGQQPAGLTLRKLLKSEMPLSWAAQRRWVEELASGEVDLGRVGGDC